MSNTIAESAYYKWEDVGKPSGRDLEFWLSAEIEYLAKNIKDSLPNQVVICEYYRRQMYKTEDERMWQKMHRYTNEMERQ